MNTPRLTVIALAVLCSLSVAGSASAKTITTDTTDGLNINNVYTSGDDGAVAKESSMWQTDPSSNGAVGTVQGGGLSINSDASALTKPYLVTGLSVRTGSAQADGAAASKMNFKSESFAVSVIGTGKDKGFNSDTETDANTVGIFISGRLGKNGVITNIDTGDLSINVSSGGGYVHGIYVGNNTTPENNNGKAPVSLTINADNTTIIATNTGTSETAAPSSGLTVYSEGQLKINGNLRVEADSVITTRGNAKIVINEMNEEKNVVLVGDIVFDYDKPTSATGVDADVQINLVGEGSSWTGNTVIAWNGQPADPNDLTVSKMKLGLSKGAVWTPTATTSDETTVESGVRYTSLNSLTMDGGAVNITGNDINVTVDEMSGSGSVNLAADLEADAEAATGNLTVTIAAEGAALDVNLMNKDMTSELTADDIDAKKAGELMSAVEGVKTSTSVKEGMVNAAFGIDDQNNVTYAPVNTLMQSTLELATATPLAINRILMNDVRKRLGDIRTDTNTHGAWARYDGGRLSGSNDLENDFNTVQVGYDFRPEGSSNRFGVAFSYTNSETEYARGSADMDAYSLAAYYTWLADNGAFVDVVGRIAKLDTDMKVDGSKDGSMDNLAASLSAEAGWRFSVTESTYIEPQVELTYTYVDSESLNIGSAEYDIESVDSLMGRIGFAAGLKCPNDFGNVYVRASAVHEFLGDSEISAVNGSAAGIYEIDGKDTWFEYGLGANFNISTNTYMWADVERTSGGVLDEDWRATVGVRYSW